MKPVKHVKPTITNLVNNVEDNSFSEKQDDDKEGFSEEGEEQIVTPSKAKKVKAKKVARKSLVHRRSSTS